MSFFSKLRSRLNKSSAKIEAGLDDLVAEGADDASDAPEAPEPPHPDSPPSDPRTPARPPEPDAPPRPPEPDTPPRPPEPETPPRPPEPDAPPRPPEPAPETPTPEPPAPEPPRPPEPAPQPRPTPPQAPDPTPAPAEARRRGFFSRILRADEAPAASDTPTQAPARAPRRLLDDAMLEELEDLLIQADLGVSAAARVAANMAEGRFGRRLSAAELKRLLAAEVAATLEPVARPLPLKPLKPQVVLVVGVNGSGKTTTIGKLAAQLRAAGKSVVIAAGDTFRAAAVEQLQVWGERAGVPVLTAPEGSDPASLAYDALERCERDGVDLLMIDTAGRLQNRADLMAELEKILRVLRKRDPTAPHDVLLVLDATVGQNALSQVELFGKVAGVTGLVMTKLDGTAKGGVLVALADRFGLPIHAVGVGESLDDLAPFDPEEFARALTGAED